MAKLESKTALVTGGSSGIGLAAARLFAQEGAHVYIFGPDAAEVADAQGQIGAGCTGVHGDITSAASLDSLYERIGRERGKLDVVFANAGVIRVQTFPHVTEEHFDREFDVNVRGTFFTVQKALPLLPDGASVILTSSIANFGGTAGFCVYSATKAAVRSFARSLSNELGARRIRVNSLSPGPTVTPIAAKMGRSDEQAAAFRAKALQQIPLGRYGQPEETARAALFLACDDSSFITGIDLCVDGGKGQI